MNKTLKIVFSLLLFISFSIPAFANIDETMRYWAEQFPNEYPVCTEKSILKVTFGVFCGRPDPYFFIDDQATFDCLKNLINKKQKVYLKNINLDYNFYRGIEVQLLKKIEGFPEKIIIYNNNFMDANSKEIFFETHRNMEKYLLDMGLKKGTINQEIYEMIQENIKEKAHLVN